MLLSKYKCCFTPTEARWLIRDGKREGGGGGGRKSEWLDRALRSIKTEKAVDHRQNNNYVKAAGTSPLRSS